MQPQHQPQQHTQSPDGARDLMGLRIPWAGQGKARQGGRLQSAMKCRVILRMKARPKPEGNRG